jgi:hypothetical protein
MPSQDFSGKGSRYPDKMPSRDECVALEASSVKERGVPWLIWYANALNSIFESRGVKGKDGRGAAPSDIRPETIRHGELAQGL